MLLLNWLKSLANRSWSRRLGARRSRQRAKTLTLSNQFSTALRTTETLEERCLLTVNVLDAQAASGTNGTVETVTVQFPANTNDRAIVVMINGLVNDAPVTAGVTYSLAISVNSGGGTSDKIYYAKLGNSVAAQSFTISGTTWTGVDKGLAVLALSGVDQTTPVEGGKQNPQFTTATSSLNITSEPGDLVVDALYVFSGHAGGIGSPIAGTSQTTLMAAHPGDSQVAASYQPGSATTTMSWSNISYAGGSGHIAININQHHIPTLTASIVGNDLVIEDTDGTGKNNVLSVSRSGANIIISDANEQFATAIGGAVLSNASKTVTVPASALGGGGKIIVKGQGGSDSLSVDDSTDLGFDVDYQGGSGTSDSLTLAAATVTSVTHAFTNANDGSVTIVNGGTRVITYTGLEPITDNLSATDRIFTFNGGDETITLTDASGANMTIDSDVGGESVTFANPTGSLTINAGTGDDTINVQGADALYAGSLTINGDAGSDTVNFQTNATSLAGGSVTVTADVINVSAALTTGGGNVSLTATGNVTLSGANADVTTGGGTFTVEADSDDDLVGTFTSNNAGSAVSASGGAISIIAADVVLTGTLAGTSTVTIAPSTAGSTIGIGGGTGTFNVSDAELALLADGFSQITIGTGAQSTTETFSSTSIPAGLETFGPGLEPTYNGSTVTFTGTPGLA